MEDVDGIPEEELGKSVFLSRITINLRVAVLCILPSEKKYLSQVKARLQYSNIYSKYVGLQDS